MKNNIPTADEFFLQNNGQHQSVSKMMIEFAKLHVEAALEAASCNAILASYDNKANKPGESLFKTITSNDVEWRPCSESILNAYPLKNIK